MGGITSRDLQPAVAREHRLLDVRRSRVEDEPGKINLSDDLSSASAHHLDVKSAASRVTDY